MVSFRNRPVGLIAVKDAVEVAEIPTLETWDLHDCKVTVTRPEGLTSKVQLSAKIDCSPDEVFDILVDPDNARYFSTVAAVTYRKVLQDDKKGTQRIEIEQAGQWRFLWLSGCFFTRLFVYQNKKEGVVEFNLAKEGFMKKFTGRWEIRPFDQHALNEISHRSNVWRDLGYRIRSAIPGNKPETTLVTLEQSILSNKTMPSWFIGYVNRVTASIVQTIIRDLRSEVDRVKAGKPIPEWQMKKLRKAKRITDSRSRKMQRTTASLMLRRRNRRFVPPPFLF